MVSELGLEPKPYTLEPCRAFQLHHSDNVNVVSVVGLEPTLSSSASWRPIQLGHTDKMLMVQVMRFGLILERLKKHQLYLCLKVRNIELIPL